METILYHIKARFLIPFMFYIGLAQRGQYIAAIYGFCTSDYLYIALAIIAIFKGVIPALVVFGVYYTLRIILNIVFYNYRAVFPTAAIWVRARRKCIYGSMAEFANHAAELVTRRILKMVKRGKL